MEILGQKSKVLFSMLPPKNAISVYSLSRQVFLSSLKNESPKIYTPSSELSQKLWGIDFRVQLFNAAGVFKDFSCYDFAFKQGAGAYLVGTITWDEWGGNMIDNIHLPFVIYNHSRSASNSIGLANKGFHKTIEKVSELEKKAGFPIGMSLAISPKEKEINGMYYLVEAMKICEQIGIDFIEINESCPNVPHDEELKARLEYIKNNFLNERKRNFPVIVKFSNDIEFSRIAQTMELLFELGYDGINLGNSSTDYEYYKNRIDLRDRPLFDYFSKHFKGGVSGEVLRDNSLIISREAMKYLKLNPPSQEFHIIRTGGIGESRDIKDSKKTGILMNQWHTKYLESGENPYKQIFDKQ